MALGIYRTPVVTGESAVELRKKLADAEAIAYSVDFSEELRKARKILEKLPPKP